MTRLEILNQILAEEARIAEAKKKKAEQKGKRKARVMQEESDMDSDISIGDCIVVSVEPNDH